MTSERAPIRLDNLKKLTMYAAAVREEAVTCGAGPSEVEVSAFVESLAYLLRTVAEKQDLGDDWLDEKAHEMKTGFAGGYFDRETGEPHPMTSDLVRIFGAEYVEWAKRETGEAGHFVTTRYDLEVLAKDVVPYLRERSGAKAKPALAIWERICRNFFRSDLTGRARHHLIRDVGPWLQALELGPVGRDREEAIDDESRPVVEKFLEHAPGGRAKAADARALIERAGSVGEAIAGIDWMFQTEKDEYLAKNRPRTLGFVTRNFDKYERSKPKPGEEKRLAKEKAEMVKHLSLVSGGTK
jgi:hypothetical protein